MGYLKQPDTMITLKDYKALGESLFGPRAGAWKFYCPECKQGHTKSEADAKWPKDLYKPGQVCPHCGVKLAPPATYNTYIGFRVLVMPADLPDHDIPPQGSLIYALPFWQDGDTPHPRVLLPHEVQRVVAERAVAQIIEAVPEKPAPKPAPPKKGGPSGYGFRF